MVSEASYCLAIVLEAHEQIIRGAAVELTSPSRQPGRPKVKHNSKMGTCSSVSRDIRRPMFCYVVEFYRIVERQPGTAEGIAEARAKGMEEMPGGQVQALRRAVDILGILANGPASLSDIADRVKLPKTTAFRLLGTLAYKDLVIKDPAAGHYLLGPGLLRVAQGVLDGGALMTSLAKPGLVRLWERTEETITLHVRAGTERICIEELTSLQAIRYSATVGSSSPLHAGAAGKLLLAYLEPGEQARLLRSLNLYALTPDTITDRAELRAELRRIRRQGWAFSASEGVVEVNALSVPVGGPGSLILALSVVGPANRLTRAKLMPYLDDLVSASRIISDAMGAGGNSRI